MSGTNYLCVVTRKLQEFQDVGTARLHIYTRGSYHLSKLPVQSISKVYLNSKVPTFEDEKR